jgi:peroxiredoxin
MPKVEIDLVAPDFELPDFRGTVFRLAELRSKSHVLLVFNRGFL